jgi:1-acyl-sn-glycerol-3-phosphate acyltransferase
MIGIKMSKPENKRRELPYNPLILRFARKAASIMSRVPGCEFLYLVFGGLLYPLFKAIFFWGNEIEVHNRENLPPSGRGILFLCNHVSAADGPVIATILWPRALWFASKESLYRSWPSGLSWMLVTLFHTFPVRRGRWDNSAVKFIERLLYHRKNVLVFPEGTRSKNGTLQRGKAGIGLIILQTRPIVVPVLITGLELILPLGQNFKPCKGQKAVVKFGSPMDLSGWWEKPAKKETGQGIVDEVMAQIGKMKQKLEQNIKS